MRILVVDDEIRLGRLLADALEDAGHAVVAVGGGQAAIDHLDSEPVDLVITDLKMAPPDGMAVLAHARSRSVPPDVVIVTAHGSVTNAVEAMRAGALDYVTKPFELEAVVSTVERIEAYRDAQAERSALREENARLVERLGDSGKAFDGIVGESPVMEEVFSLARKVADTDATVLIRGESGTGKGRIARAIHAASPRASHPFVKINCGALPDNLLESELFGHERGAFTGAVREKPGRFELAEGGTVFLDEIGEITPALQVKLLQVLEEKAFVRVGGTTTLHCDTRLIAATHRDLEHMIKDGEFREDLYYRLNVFPIDMPPLRARGNDVLLLIRHTLERRGRTLSDVSAQARDKLLTHPFPGNVRELENLLERALILAGTGPITEAAFPSLLQASTPGVDVSLPEGGLSLDAVEKSLIERALSTAGGNKSQAARLLGVTRRTLYSRMEKHGLVLSEGVSGDEPE